MVIYVDKYGRCHLKSVTELDPFPTNNAYIYSFYAKMVGLPVEITGEADNDLTIKLVHGTLNRHPNTPPPIGVPISHDEIVGIAGLDSMYADEIVWYGEHNHWQFCDIPGFKPIPFRKLVLDDVIEAYEGLANEKNPRTAVIKYPAIYPIAFYHRPEQQYFYYRCAERSPGIIRTVYFILASLFTIRRKEKTTVMLGFKLKKLMQKPSLADRLVNYMMDKFGDFKGQAEKYFPAGHPILERL